MKATEFHVEQDSEEYRPVDRGRIDRSRPPLPAPPPRSGGMDTNDQLFAIGLIIGIVGFVIERFG